MTQKHTHRAVILDYLLTHKGITSMEAFELFGITRLSATIFELRRYGYTIVSESKTCTNRFGERCTFSEYQLIPGTHANDEQNVDKLEEE